jgi:hypothetical protein
VQKLEESVGWREQLLMRFSQEEGRVEEHLQYS